MSRLNYTTTALLFPAIPLLMLVFGNRFTALSVLIRKLHDDFFTGPQDEPQRGIILTQLNMLTKRVRLLRNTQIVSCMGFFFNLVTIFGLYAERYILATYLFAFALLSMTVAILLYMLDVFISASALDIHLSDLKKD